MVVFDFIRQLLRTRNSKRMIWTLSVVAFVISANLDNLTTTVMMLTIMHGIIPSRRQRMFYGSAILLSANCGGALTVIGNPEGLVLWNGGAVTATSYSMSLLLPCLATWLVPTYLISRSLPERVDTEMDSSCLIEAMIPDSMYGSVFSCSLWVSVDCGLSDLP